MADAFGLSGQCFVGVKKGDGFIWENHAYFLKKSIKTAPRFPYATFITDICHLDRLGAFHI
ncbi:MAG: hypothetical protein HC913_14420 [Microscillaceae bacterium]|nr:hypothetical protein [Microscillaceae bacterium]